MTDPNIPSDIANALSSDKNISGAFAKLPEGQREQFVKWVEESDEEQIRTKRIDKLIGILVRIAGAAGSQNEVASNLLKSLDLADGMSFVFYGAPWSYFMELGLTPVETEGLETFQPPYDFIQLFTENRTHLEENFLKLMSEMKKNGMVWITWPKKETGISPDLDENVVRETGIKIGLADVKILSIDEVWTGMKFIYPVANG